jgi:hypothetical protein
MHYVCFHFEFEHMGFDPDDECDAPDCPSAPFDRRDYDATALPESSALAAAPCGLLAPDPAFQKLDTAELLAMVPRATESVLRRGRAAMELGRRAADDPALLTEVAALIRDPANRRLMTTGPVSGLPAGNGRARRRGQRAGIGAGPRTAAEWPPGDQSDFARLMTSSGAAWPPPPAHKTKETTGGSPYLRDAAPGARRPAPAPPPGRALRG